MVSEALEIDNVMSKDPRLNSFQNILHLKLYNTSYLEFLAVDVSLRGDLKSRHRPAYRHALDHGGVAAWSDGGVRCSAVD